MAIKGLKDSRNLLLSVMEADTDEDCLGLILARVAKENDNLADSFDLDESKIIASRVKCLMQMADLVEKKIKLRNHVSIDPNIAAEKILRFLIDKVIETFSDMNLGMEMRNAFMKQIQYKLEEWETVKKTVLADAGSNN